MERRLKMVFRRSAAITAIAGTLVLGTAAAALADSGGGTRLAVGGSACVGPVVANPMQFVLETGSAFQTGTQYGASVRWSIWTNSIPDLNTASRAIRSDGTTVSQDVQNTGSDVAYYWGCLFNNSSGKVDYSVTIDPIAP
jgi:hypothetical protein